MHAAARHAAWCPADWLSRPGLARTPLLITARGEATVSAGEPEPGNRGSGRGPFSLVRPPPRAGAYLKRRPLRKSVAKLRAIEESTAFCEMIRPSSRFWFSDVDEKFSEPMNTRPRPVP